MNVDIIPIHLGYSISYVLRGDSIIAVDCGIPGKGKDFIKGLEDAGIAPEDVKLIVATHAHSDHVGSASEMKEITGAKIALHISEAKWLEEPTMPVPPGVTFLGRMFVLCRRYIMPVEEVTATGVDILVGDEGMSLEEYGIPGSVIWTPGHTHGSLSVLLDSGEVFAGDLAMSGLPLRLTPGLTTLAEDMSEVVKSWEMLIEKGATMVYPAHGKPFPISFIEKGLKRYRARSS